MQMPFGLVRGGARWVLRRVRYRGYFLRAADLLWRELPPPTGGPERMERWVRSAVKRASKGPMRAKLEASLLGETPDAFATLVEKVACELPEVIAEDEPDWARQNEKRISRGFARAVRAAVVGAEDSDQVAQSILDAGGRGTRTREEWLVLSASVTAITVGSIAVYLGADALTDNTPGSVVAALVAAAASVTGICLKVDADVRAAHSALRALVVSILAPNVEKWVPPARAEDRYVPRALSAPIAEELSRMVETTGYEGAMSQRTKEVFWRWSGVELEEIRAGHEKAAEALDRLMGRGSEWRGARCISRQVDQLVGSTAPHDPVQAEIEYGSVVFELLVCCAAVALELDHALGLVAPDAKAA